MRVSRRRVQDVYQFTDEEFDKFIRLSNRIDETNNMTQSVIEIWGDLKIAEERKLKRCCGYESNTKQASKSP